MKNLLLLLTALLSLPALAQENGYNIQMEKLIKGLSTSNISAFEDMKLQASLMTGLENCKTPLSEDMINGVTNKLQKKHEAYIGYGVSSFKRHQVSNVSTVQWIGLKRDPICDQFNTIHLYYLVNTNKNYFMEFLLYEVNNELYISDKNLVNNISTYETWLQNHGTEFYLDADVIKSSVWKNSYYEEFKDSEPIKK